MLGAGAGNVDVAVLLVTLVGADVREVVREVP